MPEQPTIRRALISVYDKTGIVDFARALHDEFGVEILSTGGTAQTLRDAGIPVTLVEEVTGLPEMMDGRVKTLHPRIHAAILADRDNPDHMRQLAEQGIAPIDMVVVNLYPFEKTVADPNCTFEQAIEMIDIGGPCLLRAAAKNHRHVLVSSDPEGWHEAIRFMRGEHSVSDAADRLRFATNALLTTSEYDAQITEWLSSRLAEQSSWPGTAAIFATDWGKVRYGENPHQSARLLGIEAEDLDLVLADDPSVLDDVQTRMSFNNYLDANAALHLCAEVTRAGLRPPVFPAGSGTPPIDAAAHCVCFIKHTNACGVAVDRDPVEAYGRAYLGDPNAAMGGILAVNFGVEAEFAAAVLETYGRWGKPLKEAGHPNPPGGFFVEVWISPWFDKEAIAVIRGQVEGRPKKDWGERVRLLAVGDMTVAPDPRELDYKRIAGGMLVQTRDLVGLNEEQWQVVTKRAPTDAELADLRLAWLVCKHTKSNAITICKDGMLLGNGAGQMSRVMSCRIATWLAQENGHADKLAGAAAASDAFFPFRDGPDILMNAGITALIQPGGSKRDADTIAACDERGVAMIFTGTRHFRH